MREFSTLAKQRWQRSSTSCVNNFDGRFPPSSFDIEVGMPCTLIGISIGDAVPALI